MRFRNGFMPGFDPACAAIQRKPPPAEGSIQGSRSRPDKFSQTHQVLGHTFAKASLALLLLGTLIAGLAYLAEAAPPAQTVDQGRALFEQKCTACHTIGGGKKVGPDLKGVTARRDQAWLTRWLSAPDKMLAQKDPTATQLLQENNNVPMPNMALSSADVTALLAYLTASDKGTAAPAAQPAAPALPAGDAALGQQMFSGVVRFQNGGPPCLACHTIAGIGSLGGGTLGPDLTPAFNKYGESGLATFLSTVPLPTMNAVWTAHPFTPQEAANLEAFLQQASGGGPPVDPTGLLAGASVLGAAALVVLAQLYWRRRLTAVRRPLVAHSRVHN
jgi:mono/diheme cytochrome c family protein